MYIFIFNIILYMFIISKKFLIYTENIFFKVYFENMIVVEQHYISKNLYFSKSFSFSNKTTI